MSTTTNVQNTASQPGHNAPSKAWHISLWILQALLAAAFVFFGAMKLTGAEEVMATFEAIGTGAWFGYVTGVLEIGGAVLLLIPALAALGALILAVVMVGAILTHLFFIGGSSLMPLFLLALLSIVVWGRRERLLGLLDR